MRLERGGGARFGPPDRPFIHTPLQPCAGWTFTRPDFKIAGQEPIDATDTCFFVGLSVSGSLAGWQSVCLFACLPIGLSVCLSVSVCLPVLYVRPPYTVRRSPCEYQLRTSARRRRQRLSRCPRSGTLLQP